MRSQQKIKRWTNEQGLPHREDGPAIEYLGNDNRKAWFIHGRRHREDGPAVTTNNHKEWWLDNIHLTEEKFNQEILKRKLNLV